MARLTVVTGPARSGKSAFAEERAAAAAGGRPVAYVATARAADEEMAQRIRRHRQRRPAHWATWEAPEEAAAAVAEAGATAGAVLVDGLGMLVANWMAAGLDDEGVLVRVRELLEAARRAAGPVVLVTDEVGWGVVPEHPVARRFRDLLGLGNQEAAAAADEVYLVVAGVPLRLKPGGPAAEPGRPVPPPRGSAAP